MAKPKDVSHRERTRPGRPGEGRRPAHQHLADTFDLYSQTKQARWNVKGMQFFQLHELFDTLAAAVGATALGGTALGTARMAAAASRLPEYPLDAVEGRQHVEAVTPRFASLANGLPWTHRLMRGRRYGLRVHGGLPAPGQAPMVPGGAPDELALMVL